MKTWTISIRGSTLCVNYMLSLSYPIGGQINQMRVSFGIFITGFIFMKSKYSEIY